jgi:hypothetical protein
MTKDCAASMTTRLPNSAKPTKAPARRASPRRCLSGTGTSLTSSMLKYETLERSSVTAPMSKRTIMRG